MGWTNPRTWEIGELVTAAMLNTHVRDNLNGIGPRYRLYKPDDETVTSSTVLQDDDDLLFPVAANEVWAWHGSLWFDSLSAENVKFCFTAPSGATGWWFRVRPADSTVPKMTLGLDGRSVHQSCIYPVGGFVMVGATPGYLKLQWAQQASDPVGHTLKTGSWITAERLSP